MTICRRICHISMQLLVAVYFVVTPLANGETYVENGRKPANFVPDDDLIIVPIVVEKSMIERFNDRHENTFKGARKKLEFWMKQEEYAEAYGLQNTGFVRLPTAAQKEQFLQKHYLRFISKDVEKNNNEFLQDTWQSWTADDEIDAIDAVEQHEKVLVYAKKNRGQKVFKKEETVKVGKDRIKFGFQPRIELGMLKFTMKSKYFYGRAWVGINGNQELNIERKFKSTGTKVFANYFIDQTRILCALDQKIYKNLSFRFSHSKDVDEFENLDKTGITEDNVSQLRFGMRF